MREILWLEAVIGAPSLYLTGANWDISELKLVQTGQQDITLACLNLEVE